MKRKLTLLLCVILLTISQMGKAQGTENSGGTFWYFHEKDTNPDITLSTSAEDIMSHLSLGLEGENGVMKKGTWLQLQRTETDAFGNVHVTYNQMTDAKKYSEYQLVLHFHPDGSLYYKNGAMILEADDPQQTRAIGTANKISAERAAVIATGSPLSEAVWTYANYKNVPREAYKVKDASKLQYVYVDAYSGEVLYTIPMIHPFARWSEVQGNVVNLTAKTSYNGLQQLTVMQTDKGYILRDPLRNIITIDATEVYADQETSTRDVATYTQACDDALFTNEEALLNQKYTTKLRSLNLWLDPTIPELPKSINLRIYYVDDNNHLVSEVINTPIDCTTIWNDKYDFNRITFPFESLPDIDLQNYHHYIELKIDDRIYNHKDIIKSGHKETDFMLLDGELTYLQCYFDVEIAAQQPAIDVHWAIQTVYDMYDKYYGIKGCDGKGSQIINIVNPGNNVLGLHDSEFPNNACALGYEAIDCNDEPSYIMLYGMGGAGTYKPLTPFDVTAHEFTHNVTAGCCNNLEYLNESGALNEALADCMAMVAEDYLYGAATWRVGEDVTLTTDYMRSFSDPWYSGSVGDSLVETNAQPKYYGGSYWFDYTNQVPSSENDCGGVHHNAGVFTHLFYLLCEGADGLTNEFGETADFQPVGMDMMKDIVFHTMRYYDSSLCSYEEIADNLMMTVEDLYGADIETTRDVQNKLLQAYKFVGMKAGMAPTGITHPLMDAPATHSRTYNLYGFPVTDDYKGIMIKDGKKVVGN